MAWEDLFARCAALFTLAALVVCTIDFVQRRILEMPGLLDFVRDML